MKLTTEELRKVIEDGGYNMHSTNMYQHLENFLAAVQRAEYKKSKQARALLNTEEIEKAYIDALVFGIGYTKDGRQLTVKECAIELRRLEANDKS